MNVIKNPKAGAFYSESLRILKESEIPFMVGGTFAVNIYLKMNRETKDLDIFCKAPDYTKILQVFRQAGYKTELTDERWLAKVFKGKFFFDIVFNSAIALMPVTDDWFKQSKSAELFSEKVNLLPPTELIWSKVFVQNREKYDGNDIAHMILLYSKDLDWKRLLNYMDHYWEVLLLTVLRFRFIYPSEREVIPKWLLNELFERITNQINLPTSQEKVCRGRILSYGDFEVDIKEWGFTDIMGWQHESK